MASRNRPDESPSSNRWIDLRLSARNVSRLGPYLPLLILGIVLQILILGIFSTASELSWYPSRLGPPAEWLDQRVYTLVRPLFSIIDNPRGIVPIATYFVTLTTMFGLYALSIRIAWRRGTGTRAYYYLVLGFSALFMITSLLQPYLSSQDIFSYAFYAHISTLYGGNPYTAVPRDFPFDPLFGAIFWKDQPSNYGPLWTYVTAFVTLLTGTNTALTLLGIKLIVTVLALGTIPLVWGILSRTTPKMRLAGTVLYAWNPLVVLETSGSGHNDSVIGFFVLLGLFLYARNAKLGGLAALVISVLTKYVTVVLLPLYLLLWLRDCANTRERLLTACKFAAATVALLAISYAPLYSGLATFQVASFGTNPSAYVNSPLELGFREIRVLLGDSREIASLPLRYRAWWVTTNSATALWSKPDASDSALIGLPPSTPLMVVEPRRGPWLHVYAPRLDQFGYVVEQATDPTPAPTFAGAAGTASALAQMSNYGTNAERANTVLRIVTGILFLALFLHIARRTKNYEQLIYSSLAALFASYWLLQTWFWPWYLMWGLPLAALLPNRRLAALMVAFSLTTLGLHAQIDVALLPYMDALYEYRSLAIFGLPVLLVGASLALSRFHINSALTAPSEPRRRRKVMLTSAVLLAILIAAGTTLIATSSKEAQQAAASSEMEFQEPSADWVEHYWIGMDLLAKNNYQEAVAYLTRAIETRPDYTDAYRMRSIAFLRMRRFDEAVADLTTILASEGDDPELLLARGIAYQQTQRFTLALQDFARAITMDPMDPRAHRFRGQAYHELGLINEAIDSQQRALALSPYSAVLYRELAGMHATLGHFSDALVLYDAAISLDRYDVESYVGRASILRILGRGEETIPDLREVLVLSNDEDLRNWARRTMAALSGSNTSNQGTDLWQGP